MIYELRIYRMHPGRMDAIVERFRDHTLGLFPRHGIRVADFWLDAEGREALYYVCEFDSPEAKAEAWARFAADPDWIRERARSEESGAIVESVESYVMERAAFFEP